MTKNKKTKEHNKQSKRYNKLLTQYNTYINAINEIKNLILKSDLSLEDMAKIEQKACSSIRSAIKFFKANSYAKINLSPEMLETINCTRIESEQLLYTIRSKYILEFNKKYGCNIAEITVTPDKLIKISIQEYSFNEIMKELMPNHPKDEYKSARMLKRRFTIHSGVTNTGKTHNALKAMKAAERGIYLAPLRLLALQVHQNLNTDGFPCTLLTGEEEVIVPNAKYIASTIEKLNTNEKYDVAIIDEAQMITEKQRGSAWTKAILGALADEIHICCSPNAIELIISLIQDCGDEYTILSYERDTELKIDERQFTFPDSVEQGDALIAFSKKMVLGIASLLEEKGIKTSVLYGNLPPETREKQMQMFINHETDVVVATDAIGMGLNLPIKRIVFMGIVKYDGNKVRGLDSAEVKQIAGRAGRKNLYDIGYVNSIMHKDYIEKALKHEMSSLVSAYYLPSIKFILGLPTGSLKQRLTACQAAQSQYNNFEKADISQPLYLLDIIDKDDFSIEEKCNLIFIPFESKNEDLLNLWKGYVKAYAKKKQFSLPPQRSTKKIDALELHYKSLELYYAFGKAMNVDFDIDKLIDLKHSISDDIHDILRTSMKSMGSKCIRCGKKLNWDFPYSICEDCYTGRYDYTYDY